jgi:hypothetical protein
MNIFQRNTTLSTNNTQGYSVDRMWGFSGASTAATYSQISSTGLAGFPFAIRCQRTAGNTGTNGVFMGQIIESNNLQDLQGQSVTVSFWARAGANYSATGSTLYVTIRTGTVADQGLNTLISPGWTGASTQQQTVTLTTSWQYFTKTYTISATAQEITAFFEAYPTGTAGANDYYDITGFQLEKGSTATSFDYRPYGTELQLCQRYLFRPSPNGTSFAFLAQGAFANATGGFAFFPFPTQMRTTPTFALDSGRVIGDYTVYVPNGGAYVTLTSATLNTVSTPSGALLTLGFASGGTAGQSLFMSANGAATISVQFSSEL